MKLVNLRSWGVIIISLALLAIFSSCEDTAPIVGDDDDSFALSSSAEGGAQAAWHAQNYVNTAEEYAEIVEGSDALYTDEDGMINTMVEVKIEAQKFERTLEVARQEGVLLRTMGDSLLVYEEWTAGGLAGRKALYYDFETGLARYYEVIHEFGPNLELTYDSLEVRADLNFTLEDDTDDRLLSIEKLSLFNPEFFVQSVSNIVTATDWDAEGEVTGAESANFVQYGEQIELVSLEQTAEINPDGSTAIAEHFAFNDGTFVDKAFSFNPDNTGSYTEVWRDGTSVSGTFDLLEPDNHAAITRTVDFASHPSVDRIEHTADYTQNPTDSSRVGVVTEKIYFNDGALDTARVEVERFKEGGVWNQHILATRSNGEVAELNIAIYDTHREIEGSFTAADGHYLTLTATKYVDGSGELWLAVYESEDAYLAGDAPLASIYIYWAPDGSGNGTITENDAVYEFEFDPNGDINVQDSEGESVTISAY